MPALTFDYLHVHEMSQWFPCLDCIAEHSKKILVPAMIDSGSSLHTLIPYSIANNLGLITSDMEKITGHGVSGKFNAYKTTLQSLHIVNSKKEYLETFDELDVIIPMKNTYNLPFIILGRSTIFSRYDITFSEQSRKITLTAPAGTDVPRLP